MKRFTLWARLCLITIFFSWGCMTDVVVTQGEAAKQKKQDAENAKQQQEAFEKKLQKARDQMEERKKEAEEE